MFGKLSTSIELTTRKIAWRKLAYMAGLLGCAGIAIPWAASDIWLTGADALVVSDRAAIATAFDARLKLILVRPGDKVKGGQPIAVIESPSLIKSLAEMTLQQAMVDTRSAQLQARSTMHQALLPFALANANESIAVAYKLKTSFDSGWSSNKSYLDAVATSYLAQEKLATMKAEAQSVEVELQGIRKSRGELEAAHASLRQVYNDGVIVAPIDGTVGSTLAMAGEALIPGSKIGQIYSGQRYVVAYLPQGKLTDVLSPAREGQEVRVSAGRHSVQGRIEAIMGFSEALPPEFQRPVRTRERSQVARITIPAESEFSIEQKARITICYFEGCSSLMQTVGRTLPRALTHARSLATAMTSSFLKNSSPDPDKTAVIPQR